MRARHRLSKLLLRQGLVYEDTAWTTTHGKWLRSQSFDKPGVQFAFDEAYDTVLNILGLTPSEHSSGGSRSVGSITKTGNGHARRLLVESSWHHRKPYRLSAEMIRRRDGQSPLVRARADRANRRLNQRWRTFDARKKRPTVAAVGVARELAGWCWSLAVMDEDNDNSAMKRQR